MELAVDRAKDSLGMLASRAWRSDVDGPVTLPNSKWELLDIGTGFSQATGLEGTVTLE
jgi:hypothetical protein